MSGAAQPQRPSLRAARAAIWPPTQGHMDEVALARLAEDAAAADLRGTLSAEAVGLLRKAGYCGLPVPLELDGAGAGLMLCAAVQRRLALADPALAIAGNMHLFSVGMATHHWRQKRDACGLLLQAIATQRRLVASAFAEPGLGGTLLHSTVTARRVPGGYRANGIKQPCSLAAFCDLICLQMQAEDGLLVAVIPASAPGVRSERSWDALGMRASGSDTIRLDDCFIPEALVYLRGAADPEEDVIFAGALVWFCVTTAATYLGVAEAALEAACASLEAAELAHLGAARATLPSVQAALGDAVMPALTLEAACAGLAERFDAGGCDARALLPAAVAIKTGATNACIRLVESVAELVGGSAYARSSRLARLWRDVQAARFHPPNRLLARQMLGRWALGRGTSFTLRE